MKIKSRILSLISAAALAVSIMPASLTAFAEDNITSFYSTDFTGVTTDVSVGASNTLSYSNNMYAMRSAVKAITENGNTYVQMSTKGGTSAGYNLGFLTGDNSKITDNSNWKTDQNFVQECDIYIPRSLAAETTSNTDALSFGISYSGVQECASARANMAIYGAGVEADFVSVQPGGDVNYGGHGGVSPTTIRTISTDEWHNIKYISDYSGINTTNGCMVKVYVDNEYFFTYSTKDSSSLSVLRSSSIDSIKAIGLKAWTKNSNITAVNFDNVKYYQLSNTFTAQQATYNNDTLQIDIPTNNVIFDGGTATITKVGDQSGATIANSCLISNKNISVMITEALEFNTNYVMSLTGVKDIYGQTLPDYTYSFTSGGAPEFKADGVGLYDSVSRIATFNLSNVIKADQTITAEVKKSDGSVVTSTVSYSGKVVTVNITQKLDYESTYTITLKKGFKDLFEQELANDLTLDFTTGDAQNDYLFNFDGTSDMTLNSKTVTVSKTDDEYYTLNLSETAAANNASFPNGVGNLEINVNKNFIEEFKFKLPSDFATKAVGADSALYLGILGTSAGTFDIGGLRLGIKLYATDGSIVAAPASSTGGSYIYKYDNTITKAVTAGQWHTAKCVVDYPLGARNVKMYIDGELFAEFSYNSTSSGVFPLTVDSTEVLQLYTTNLTIASIDVDDLKAYQPAHTHSGTYSFNRETTTGVLTFKNAIMPQLRASVADYINVTDENLNLFEDYTCQVDETGKKVTVTFGNTFGDGKYFISVKPGLVDEYDQIPNSINAEFYKSLPELTLVGEPEVSLKNLTATLTFSNVLAEGQEGKITVVNAANSADVKPVTISGKIATISGLEYMTNYNITVAADITDLNGKTLGTSATKTLNIPKHEADYAFGPKNFDTADDLSLIYKNTGSVEYVQDPLSTRGNVISLESGTSSSKNLMAIHFNGGSSAPGSYADNGVDMTKPVYYSTDIYLSNSLKDRFTLGSNQVINMGPAVGLGTNNYFEPWLGIASKADGSLFFESEGGNSGEITTNQWHNITYVYTKNDKYAKGHAVSVFIDGETVIENYEVTRSNYVGNVFNGFTFAIHSNITNNFNPIQKGDLLVDNVSVYQAKSPMNVTSAYSYNGEKHVFTLTGSNDFYSYSENQLKEMITVWDENDTPLDKSSYTASQNANVITVVFDSLSLSNNYRIGFSSLNDKFMQNADNKEFTFTSVKSLSAYLSQVSNQQTPSKDGYSVTATFGNSNPLANPKFWVCVGVFDKYNTLIAVESTDLDFKDAIGGSLTANFNLTSDCSSAQRVEIFVWDSPFTMIPLQHSETLYQKTE